MSLTRIVLWRHGETDYNAAGRMQGHLDSELTAVGWNQARFAAAGLNRYEPTAIVASDLRRATDTATVFAEASGIPLRIDKRLRETNLGAWQGLTSAELDADWPGERLRWRADPTFAPPGGERRIDVAERAVEVVTDLDGELDGTVLLATHGGLITSLTARLLGLPVEHWTVLGGVSNCHWTELAKRPEPDAEWRLITHNTGISGFSG
ncbi:glucosyl-3-phosphoglycerate phosphatase (pgm family) [Tamaricihabitans halophyticus]|uniref:Glucosyl-3-phosphoglycerate phosphatase (Pgm family) n=1 Tax=Tamaricihabitans halophyticus TaxID=1262583 RepID=A0A4R2QXE4_9PSEU|nr:histidine phosphatase family protein [Tamaricihabitans halophyticus]TCP54850.1 glucosyl-3-phosphoglycerate phosphatase (pgm family) [Tamaricihabitans halophyticus]